MPKKQSTRQKLKSNLTSKEVAKFRREIRNFYQRSGRNFPWRETRDPYFIMVSEVMLQQTQTHRVVEKYLAFLKKFHTIQSLAKAPLADVLKLWSGLGYNRRAKFLREAAIHIVNNYNGIMPQSIEELIKLPGIGTYCANAIRAFAFDKPAVCIETNIRTVFIHYFFSQKSSIADGEILTLIEQTLPTSRFREWYYGLMDKGAFLKSTLPGINAKSRHYTKQSPFKGSRREIRGKILKSLSNSPSSTTASLCKLTQRSSAEVSAVIADLIEEGFIIKKARKVSLA